MARRLLCPVLLAALLGCESSITAPGIDMPAGAVVYQMSPWYLTYHYVDSTAVQPYELEWLPPSVATPWVGLNCLGFVARTPQDTTGTFVFRYSGANTGRVRHTEAGLTDTLIGYFLPPNAQGTHGDYVVESSGLLHLTWADGTQSRYFDPTATLHFSGDTLWSDYVRGTGSTLHVEWHVAWIRQASCSF
jgi:hypothetical protein